VVSAGEWRIESVFTDDQGGFVVANAPDSPLSVRVSKAGYVAGTATVPSDVGVADLRFALSPSAAIAGRVVDTSGAPVPDVFVAGRLLLPDANALPVTATQFFAQSDLFGEYRLGGLPSGRYEVRAVRMPIEWRFGRDKRLEEALFGAGSTGDGSRLSTMSLTAGEDIRDADFTIAASTADCPQGPSVRPAPGARTATIAGRVRAESGEPLSCAAVRVVMSEVSIPQVFTDRDGRYSIEGLSAGSFVVQAAKIGFIPLQYGQRRPLDAERPVVLREGQRRMQIDFTLPHGGAVSGTVVDEFGEPLEGASIVAFRVRRDEGRMRAFSTQPPRTTDDRGQYRIAGIDPGTYVVVASARGSVSAPAAGRRRGYASIYYPGTSDPAMAQRIVLDAGRDATAIDFAFTSTPTATVSGSIVRDAGRPFIGNVTIAPSSRSGAVAIDSWSAPVDMNGRFTVRGVPPGDYVVKAMSNETPAPSFGMRYLTVAGDADPPSVSIAVVSGATLEGRLIVDGSPETNVAGLGLTATPSDPDYTPMLGRPTMWARQADGTFRIRGVVGPNRILPTEMPACEGCYLKSVVVNGMDATDRPFDFGISEAVIRDVEVVVSDAAAEIEGRATDVGGERVRVYSVLVFATDSGLWYPRSRYVKTASSRPDGSFRVTGLPPGDYFVVAQRRGNAIPLGVEPHDSELLEPLSVGAQRVMLVERDRQSVNVRIRR
jgi:hypothetical protein